MEFFLIAKSVTEKNKKQSVLEINQQTLQKSGMCNDRQPLSGSFRWSRRPLKQAQVSTLLNGVTHEGGEQTKTSSDEWLCGQ